MKRKAILLLVLMATALLVASGTALALTCTAGTTCLGTNGDDVINGTMFADTIKARLGNDTVFGKGHNDTIFGQTGEDNLVGGAGRDTLVGGDHTDTLVGGDQSDRLAGGFNTSVFTSPNPAEQLKGGFGDDIYLFSGAWGSDEIPAAAEPPWGTDGGGNLTEANDAIVFSAYESQAVKQPAVFNSLWIDLQEGYAHDRDDGPIVNWEPGDIERVKGGDGKDVIHTEGAATGVNHVDCGGGYDHLTRGPEDPPAMAATGCEVVIDATVPFP